MLYIYAIYIYTYTYIYIYIHYIHMHLHMYVYIYDNNDKRVFASDTLAWLSGQSVIQLNDSTIMFIQLAILVIIRLCV